MPSRLQDEIVIIKWHVWRAVPSTDIVDDSFCQWRISYAQHTQISSGGTHELEKQIDICNYRMAEGFLELHLVFPPLDLSGIA